MMLAFTVELLPNFRMLVAKYFFHEKVSIDFSSFDKILVHLKFNQIMPVESYTIYEKVYP